MRKPLKELVFKQLDGIWKSINEEKPRTLADVLTSWNIEVSDTCTFARFVIYGAKKHDQNFSIWYRVYGGKITITIWDF